ncbi:RagB/SusD family nutrient uptake outer membrane protein [Chitinophaga arvensicola]|uniref:SusD family protein n=1 Tax=Chitinophaga arvensicola TaxID=29529 RepID=A0A1I0R4N5_9BACT|nr:RagB/SusD family nutrient uptake outer membrane protein [Chitinophaga arvensicola]SEW35383.1 SusD family protein [Chitinophaga arvensicola]
MHIYKSRISIFFLTGLLPALLLLTGCSKLIEVNRPSNTVGNDVIFKTDERAVTALMTVYAQMINYNSGISLSNGALPVFTGLMSDEYVKNSSSADEQDKMLEEFYKNVITRTNTIPDISFWNNGYEVIFSANAVIEGVAASGSPALTARTRDLLNGEAKLVRAFQHFYLANLYGDIPIVLTTDINQTRTLSRRLVSEVYQQVEKDLKDAFLLLPADYSAAGNTRYRPNKWVAAALLARLYLYEKNYPAAAEQAGLVINNGLYKLLPPANVFMINSEECLWQLEHPTRGNAAPEEVNFFTPAMQYNKVPEDYKMFFTDPEMFAYFSTSGQMIPRCPMTQALINAFETGDERKAAWTDTVPVPVAPPYNGNGYRFSHKTENINLDGTLSPSAYTVMRLAEMYLIRAEALAQQGTDLAGATADLNKIRNRAGLPDLETGSREQLLAAVAQERRVEFFGEWGHRWFDLKRTGKATETLRVITEKQPWSNDHLLLPLPQIELINNPMLKQNPGY